MRVVVTAMVVALGSALVLAGCSHDDPVLTQKETVTTVRSPAQAAAASDLGRAVARLSDPKWSQQPLGADLAPEYLRIEMLAFGLSDTEASCVVDGASKAGGSSLADLSLGDASSSDRGFDPSVLMPCVGTERLATLASSQPDFSRAPAAQVRDLLTRLAVKELGAAGLSSDEATCVVSKTVDGLPDDQLTAALGGGSSGQPVVNGDVAGAVRTCLSPARVRELAT
jgi:hypothetical protein